MSVNNLSNSDFSAIVNNLIESHTLFSKSSDFERTFDSIIHRAEEYCKYFPDQVPDLGRLVEEIYYIFAYTIKDKINLEISNNKKFFNDSYNPIEASKRIGQFLFKSGNTTVVAGAVGAEVIELLVKYIAFRIKEQKLLNELQAFHVQMGNTVKKIYKTNFYISGRYNLLQNTLKTNRKEVFESIYFKEGIIAVLELIDKNASQTDQMEHYDFIKNMILRGKEKVNFFKTSYILDWKEVVNFLGYIGSNNTLLFNSYYEEILSKYKTVTSESIALERNSSWKAKFVFISFCLYIIFLVLIPELIHLGKNKSGNVLIYFTIFYIISIYVFLKWRYWSSIQAFTDNIKKSIENYKKRS